MQNKRQLRLFTKTWPRAQKNKENREVYEEIQRPLTATLEKPQVLDIRLITKIDMSLIRKEFLTLTSLCRVPLAAISVVKTRKTKSVDQSKTNAVRKSSSPKLLCSISPPFSTSSSSDLLDPRLSCSLPVTPNYHHHQMKKVQLKSLDDNNNNGNGSNKGVKVGAPKCFIKSMKIPEPCTSCGRIDQPERLHSHPKRSCKKTIKSDNNKNSPSPRKQRTTVVVVSVSKAPETIVRKTQHSPKQEVQVRNNNHTLPKSSKQHHHQQKRVPLIQVSPRKFESAKRRSSQIVKSEIPIKKEIVSNNINNNKSVLSPLPQKRSVQKPVAIKFKSKQAETTSSSTTTTVVQALKTNLKSQVPPLRIVESPNHHPPPVNSNSSSRVPSGRSPRMKVCYLCGREFGSASLPIHEPKCLEKWNRENASLPANLQRKPPPKPDHPLSQEEWNNFAWESSQALLVKCANCSRTFLPDRLVVHQRSCKPPTSNMAGPSWSLAPAAVVDQNSDAVDSSPLSPPGRPRTVLCKVCGKMFGTKSIKIHEPQCLKKWHQQNDHLPPGEREPFQAPKAMDGMLMTKDEASKPKSPQENAEKNASSQEKRPPMFPCYLCGRLFSVNSIYIHEPQCLKKWKIENDKLPPHQRRKEPQKPDIKFTPSGGVDFKGTFNRIWENHMNELETCPKCKRHFFPDRIEKHVNACAGTPVRVKKSTPPLSKSHNK